MKNYIILLCILPLISLCTANREQKQFSLFSIVSFKQEECSSVSTSGVKGTCMTRSECDNVSGGTVDGNCAASFGVCCVVTVSTCGGSITQNCSYIDNPGYPSTYSTTGDCSYTVTRCQDDICQIRLDFFSATLQQPDSTCSTTAGVSCALCSDTILDITSGTTSDSFTNNPPSNLCGTLTGQHLYLDSGRASTAATLKFTLSSSESNTWRIKVTQIECWNPSRAPPDCLQYFQGDHTHTVTSFNWDGTKTCSTGCMLADQLYQVCFRPEKGMCGMQIAVTAVSSSLSGFEMGTETENAEDAKTTAANCDDQQYLVIHGIDHETGDFYCGDFLNNRGAEAITTDRAESNGAIYTAGSNPFQFIVVSEENTETDDEQVVGFSLDVAQVACGTSMFGTGNNAP